MYVSYAKRAALCLACLGMMIPPGGHAAEQITNRPADLRLSPNGTLVGCILDAQGKPVRTAVVVRFNGIAIAKTQTNAAGRFAVSGMRSGVHEIQTGSNRSVARVWTADKAPAAAKTAALLVSHNVVRAQGCGEDGCGYGAACGCGGGSAVPFPSGDCCPPEFGPVFGGCLGGSGGLLVGGLVVAGVVTAVAVAADDDDDRPSSS